MPPTSLFLSFGFCALTTEVSLFVVRDRVDPTSSLTPHDPCLTDFTLWGKRAQAPFWGGAGRIRSAC